MRPPALTFYGRVCGRTLARAHARSGEPVALDAYLGRNDQFDLAITDFAERYADQNEQDYRMFTEAIRSGRLEAREGLRLLVGMPNRDSDDRTIVRRCGEQPRRRTEHERARALRCH